MCRASAIAQVLSTSQRYRETSMWPALWELELPASCSDRVTSALQGGLKSTTIIPGKEASSMGWEKGRSLSTDVGFLWRGRLEFQGDGCGWFLLFSQSLPCGHLLWEKELRGRAWKEKGSSREEAGQRQLKARWRSSSWLLRSALCEGFNFCYIYFIPEPMEN